MRVGMGYDVHKLVEGRKLILGGVEIPHTLGLLGHSDADVLLHAIMDALLGAAALGDIGKHFPDTDERYRGISSLKLLSHVGALLEEHQYVIENIDATVIAQKPKLRGQNRGYSGNREDPGKCKSNDGGASGIYRKRRGNRIAGSLPDFHHL